MYEGGIIKNKYIEVDFWNTIEKHKVTHALSLASTIRYFIKTDPEGTIIRSKYGLSNLKEFMVGGENTLKKSFKAKTRSINSIDLNKLQSEINNIITQDIESLAVLRKIVVVNQLPKTKAGKTPRPKFLMIQIFNFQIISLTLKYFMKLKNYI
ncbi:hypothetical protein ACTFIT_002912 [Dictyostelium discoideum]